MRRAYGFGYAGQHHREVTGPAAHEVVTSNAHAEGVSVVEYAARMAAFARIVTAGREAARATVAAEAAQIATIPEGVMAAAGLAVRHG